MLAYLKKYQPLVSLAAFVFVGSLLFSLDLPTTIQAQAQVQATPEPELIAEPTTQPQPTSLLIPETLHIPSLEITATIKPALVTATDWQLFDDAISWMNSSGTINDGNVVLYAHNTKSLLKTLPNTQVGDTIQLTSQGKVYDYQVVSSYPGTPDDVHILDYAPDTLTIYTCSGLFDAKRHIVIAKKNQT